MERASVVRLLARCANLAYRDKSFIENTLKSQSGFDRVKFYDKDHTQCFIATDRDKTVLSFRGTEPSSPADWLTDALFFKKSDQVGRVHYGFKESLNDVWPEIYLELLNNHKENLWITGHSLGGALAVLSSSRLMNQGIVPRYLCTFGQPRVGNSEFTKFMNKSEVHQRIVNSGDIVPLMPPRFPVFGYKHSGDLVLMDRNNKPINNPSYPSQIWHYVRTKLSYGLKIMSVERHSMDTYEKNVENGV
jgi:triacylglycerol lipase